MKFLALALVIMGISSALALREKKSIYQGKPITLREENLPDGFGERYDTRDPNAESCLKGKQSQKADCLCTYFSKNNTNLKSSWTQVREASRPLLNRYLADACQGSQGSNLEFMLCASSKVSSLGSKTLSERSNWLTQLCGQDQSCLENNSDLIHELNELPTLWNDMVVWAVDHQHMATVCIAAFPGKCDRPQDLYKKSQLCPEEFKSGKAWLNPDSVGVQKTAMFRPDFFKPFLITPYESDYSRPGLQEQNAALPSVLQTCLQKADQMGIIAPGFGPECASEQQTWTSTFGDEILLLTQRSSAFHMLEMARMYGVDHLLSNYKKFSGKVMTDLPPSCSRFKKAFEKKQKALEQEPAVTTSPDELKNLQEDAKKILLLMNKYKLAKKRYDNEKYAAALKVPIQTAIHPLTLPLELPLAVKKLTSMKSFVDDLGNSIKSLIISSPYLSYGIEFDKFELDETPPLIKKFAEASEEEFKNLYPEVQNKVGEAVKKSISDLCDPSKTEAETLFRSPDFMNPILLAYPSMKTAVNYCQMELDKERSSETGAKVTLLLPLIIATMPLEGGAAIVGGVVTAAAGLSFSYSDYKKREKDLEWTLQCILNGTGVCAANADPNQLVEKIGQAREEFESAIWGLGLDAFDGIPVLAIVGGVAKGTFAAGKKVRSLLEMRELLARFGKRFAGDPDKLAELALKLRSTDPEQKLAAIKELIEAERAAQKAEFKDSITALLKKTSSGSDVVKSADEISGAAATAKIMGASDEEIQEAIKFCTKPK